MLWLLDTDVIWKLAAFDLFDELIQVLQAKKFDFYYLPELYFQMKRDSTAEKHGRTSFQRVSDFLKGTKQITYADIEEQVILRAAKATYQNRDERIDGGEQSLFIATKFLSVSTIITHDKKALRTLANDRACKGIYDRVKGRVICFEQLVLRMIDKFGYQPIQSKIAPRCEIDDVMRESFANGQLDHPEVECRKWIEGHIARIKNATPGLLI